MKIVTIIGARPQFIKAAALSKAIIDFNLTSPQTKLEEIIIHTGQHYDKNMSDVFFSQMNIPVPKYQLDINGMSHGAMTGQMLLEIEKILLVENPDWVLVYGDTNSTLAGALAASKIHIKVAHVESGLRSFNMNMPEEINRILTDRVSNLLLCPTPSAIQNLNNEGFQKFTNKIVNTGDIMLDASNFFSAFAKAPKISLPDNYALCTIHRAENTDCRERLTDIFEGLSTVAENLPIVLPLHPRTKKFISKYDINISDNILLIDPIGYLEMIFLIKNSSLIFTDSGGLQKEAYFFKKYCITLRDETEWVELVKNNYNTLVGSNKEKIMNTFVEIQSRDINFSTDLYGNGDAGMLIIDQLCSY